MLLLEIFSLILAILVTFWLASLILAQLIGAPIVFSSKVAVKDLLKLAEIEKGETLIDLGCGSGKVLIIASEEFGAKGIGIDRSLYCFIQSKLNVWLGRQSNNVKIVLSDFRQREDLVKQADVIFLYLLTSVNNDIEQWLFKKKKKSARIVSLAFPFPLHHPIKTISTKTLGKKTKAYLFK